MKPVIETVDLNSLNQLRVTVSEFQGHMRLDVRHWYREGLLSENEWKPTKKGVNLSIDSIGEFRKALDKAFSRFEMGEQG